MTLNGRNHTLAEKYKIYGAHQKNLNEDRQLSAPKCRPVIVVSEKYKVCADIRGGSSERGRQIQFTLPYNCVHADCV